MTEPIKMPPDWILDEDTELDDRLADARYADGSGHDEQLARVDKILAQRKADGHEPDPPGLVDL